MLTTIKGAVRKMSSSIMEKYGSPIGSWGDLRERSPRTNGTAYTTARKNTPQAAALPMVRCGAVKPSWDIVLLLLSLRYSVRGPVRVSRPSCAWTLGAPLDTLQHPAFHHKVHRFEEKRYDDPQCSWFVGATHAHDEPRRLRRDLVKHERPRPIEKRARRGLLGID